MLEESLKAEMLANEKQRNYIEILKEALSAKMENLGLRDLLQKNEEGENQTDTFAKLMVMKKQIDEKQNEFLRNEQDIKEMEKLILDLKAQTEEQNSKINRLANEYERTLKDKNNVIINFEELSKKVNKNNMIA